MIVELEHARDIYTTMEVTSPTFVTRIKGRSKNPETCPQE